MPRYSSRPSRSANGPYGAIDAWFGPLRGGGVPPYDVWYAGAAIHSASASKSDTSTTVPCPVEVRARSAVRMPE